MPDGNSVTRLTSSVEFAPRNASRNAGSALSAALARSQAHIWLLAWEGSSQSALTDACLPLLDAAERRRFDRLRPPGARAQYAAAHSLLRVALSRYVNVPPREWAFRSSAWGKPEIVQPSAARGLRFSLSHTDGLAACIVASGMDVGIDVEHKGDEGAILEAAEQFLSSTELADCMRLPPERRAGRLYEIWTLKEALAKACGLGLQLPLPAVAFRRTPGGDLRVTFDPRIADNAASWQFYSSALTPTHQLAAAIRCGGTRDVSVIRRILSPADMIDEMRIGFDG